MKASPRVRVASIFAAVVVVFCVATAGVLHWVDMPSDAGEAPVVDRVADAALVERGAYLAAAGNCVTCHTVAGRSPFAGGRPFKLPFGTIFTSNITPDPKHGIGGWTDAQFIAAMHRGISKDGHHLYPAFPYAHFTRMPVEDILAIKAFLFAQPASAVDAPKNQVVFPFNQTWAIGFWNLAFNPDRRFEADPVRTAQLNRGAYLVEGPGHCQLCHTPLNIAFAPKSGEAMAGAVVEGVRAYNISSDPRWGIGRWSEDELVGYLGQGHVGGHGAAGASMSEVVQNSTSRLAPDDLLAIARYLLQVPPRASSVDVGEPVAALATSDLMDSKAEPDGKQIYSGACAGCHGWGGTSPAYASGLAGSRTINDASGLNVAWVLTHGAHLRAAGRDIDMPSFPAYSDDEIAAVGRFTIAAFGGKASALDASVVRKAREMPTP